MKMYYLFFEDSWQNWDGWQDISQEEREKLARVFSDHKNKLMEKLKNEHEGKRTILKYELRDPWCRPIRTIEVRDSDGMNASFINHRENRTYNYAIDLTVRNEIIQLIGAYGERMKSPDFIIEDINYLDGDMFSIFLSDHINSFYFSLYLLRARTEENSPNGMILIRLLDDIFSLLKNLKVDNAFFQHSWLVK